MEWNPPRILFPHRIGCVASRMPRATKTAPVMRRAIFNDLDRVRNAFEAVAATAATKRHQRVPVKMKTLPKRNGSGLRPARGDELRQKGHEEKGHLRIQQVRYHPLDVDSQRFAPPSSPVGATDGS